MKRLLTSLFIIILINSQIKAQSSCCSAESSDYSAAGTATHNSLSTHKGYFIKETTSYNPYNSQNFGTRNVAADVFVMPNGDFLSAYSNWEYDIDFGLTIMKINTSKDEGKTWPSSTEQTLFDPTDPMFDRDPNDKWEAYSASMPNFLLSEDGKDLHMFFLVKERQFINDNATTRNCSCQVRSSCITYPAGKPPVPDYGSCENFTILIYHSKLPLLDAYDPATDSYDHTQWTTPVEIDEAIDGYNIMINARVKRLSNGAIVLPIAGSDPLPSSGNINSFYFRCYLLVSHDDGQTWFKSQEVHTNQPTSYPGFQRGYMEPEIVEITDNGEQKILMVMRVNNKNPTYNKITIDLNASTSWDLPNGLLPGIFPGAPPFGQVAYSDENTPVSIERLPCSGDLLMIYNKDYGTSARERYSLWSAISTDEGATWGQFKEIIADPNSSPSASQHYTYSYVSLSVYKDKVLMTYYDSYYSSSGSPGVNSNHGRLMSTTLRVTSIAEFYTNPSTVCPCNDANEGLFAYWTGDADATDEHGNNDGTLTNGALAGATGNVNGAFDLDGSNDYVSFGSPVRNTAPLSVEAWVQPTQSVQSTPWNQYIIANGGETSQSYGFAISNVNVGGVDKWRFSIRDKENGWSGYAQVNASTGTNWVHLAGTWDGSNTVTLYVDGVPTTGTLSSATVPTTAKNLGIGRPSTTTYYLWNGKIDEVAIYNRVLSEDEIVGIYNANSDQRCEPECTEVSSKLIAHWSGDVDGTDERGNNDASFIGQAVAGEPGIVNNAFEFDGVGDYLEVPSVVTNEPPFSVEAWIKGDNGNASQYIVSNGGESGQSYGFCLSIRNGKWRFTAAEKGNGSTGMRGLAETDVTSDEWTHLVGVWDGSNDPDAIKLYVDGQLAATGDPASGNVGSASQKLYMGRPFLYNNYNWTGFIDEVGVYNDALTAEEIKAQFESGRSGKCGPTCQVPIPGIISWWPGDETSDPDDIKSGNHGTLNNSMMSGIAGKVSGAFESVPPTTSGVAGKYMSVPNPVINTPPYSVSVWVDPALAIPDIPKSYIISNGGESTASFGLALSTEVISGTRYWRFTVSEEDYGNPTRETRWVQTEILSANWTHLAASWDGNSDLVLYVNGVEYNTVNTSTSNTAHTDKDLMIGCSSTNNEFFDGLIDEPMIFDRVISEAEVQEIYNAGSLGLCKDESLVAYFRKGRSFDSSEEEESEVLSENNISIYPNPATNDLWLKSDTELSFVQIISVEGKVLMERRLSGTTQRLDLSLLESGVYFIKVQSADSTIDQKIVKL